MKIYFSAEVCEQLTSLVNVMLWANKVCRNGYAGHDSVYGGARDAIKALVKGETNVDISDVDWNLHGNQTFVDDLKQAVSTAVENGQTYNPY